MPVTVLRFSHRTRISWGVLRGERVTLVPGDFPTTGDFIARNDTDALAVLDGETVALAQIRPLAPVTSNQQFLCQGANYRQHIIESGLDPDSKNFNMIFTKAASCIAPADTDIVKPARVRFLDYEVELGLVFKRAIDRPVRVTEADLPNFIAGLTIVNDVSARDVQIPEMQFYKGKSFRSFGPVGPYLVLLEPGDFAKLGALELTLTVNGTIRQKDSAANLVHKPAETLSELSGVQDIFPGDLLATGTPAGCALAVPSPLRQRLGALLPERKKWEIFSRIQAKRTQYLKPGDLVEAWIRTPDGTIDLGRQRNRVVEETAA